MFGRNRKKATPTDNDNSASHEAPSAREEVLRDLPEPEASGKKDDPTAAEKGANTIRRDLLSVGEELPSLASELTETLRRDWRRTANGQEGKDRLQAVCFRYGQRLGELNISPSRSQARIEAEIQLLLDESVRTSHSRLSSLGVRAWSLLHHDIPALVRRQDRLQEELTGLQNQDRDLRQERPFYWHRLAFFVLPALALLAAEVAMGEEITKNALRLSGRYWWLFMAALLALPLVFKQLIDAWKDHGHFMRYYLGTLVVLIILAIAPLASLRSEQAMRLVLKTKGSAGTNLADPFGSVAPRVPGANGTGTALEDPFTLPRGNDPFAPTVGGGESSSEDPFSPLAGGSDTLGDPFASTGTAAGASTPTPLTASPSSTPEPAVETAKARSSLPLTFTFLVLGLLFPMLSGLAFSKTLEQADFRHEGSRVRRRLEQVQKELGEIQANFKSSQARLADHQAETVTLVEGLGDSDKFADKAITELVAVLGKAESETAQLENRIEALRDLGLKEMSKRLAREVAGLLPRGDTVLATQIKYYNDLIGGIAQIDGGKSLEKLAQSRKNTLCTTLLDGFEAGRAAAFVLLRSYEPEEKLSMVDNRRFHDALFRGKNERSGPDSAEGGN